MPRNIDLPSKRGEISQRRPIHILESQSNALLVKRGIPVSEDGECNSQRPDCFLIVSVDRKTCRSCIIRSVHARDDPTHTNNKSYAIESDRKVSPETLRAISENLPNPNASSTSLSNIISAMLGIFFDMEAYSLKVQVALNEETEFEVVKSRFTFDDAAIKTGKRHEEIRDMRDTEAETPEEVEAEKDGIVYIKWDPTCGFAALPTNFLLQLDLRGKVT